MADQGLANRLVGLSVEVHGPIHISTCSRPTTVTMQHMPIIVHRTGLRECRTRILRVIFNLGMEIKRNLLSTFSFLIF